MRDIKRIERIMSIITKIWSKYPDIRFNQLINHLQRRYENEKYVKKAYVEEIGWGIVDVSYPDLFYVEDDKFEEFLLDYLYEIND